MPSSGHEPLYSYRNMFICFSEEQCDYFTNTIPCYFGSFTYSGNPLTLSVTYVNVSIRFKKSNDLEITTIIDNCPMNDAGNRVTHTYIV